MRIFLKYKIFGIVLLSLVAGWYLHYYYYLNVDDRSKDIVQLREKSLAHQFINPLILVADNRKIEFNQYKELKDQVESLINKASGAKGIDSASFYFKDLNSAEWIGVNEEELYSPASMLKVVTLMAYSKLASNNAEVLLEKAHYEPGDVSGQFYKPKQLKSGNYNIRQLLQQMIVESDNDAMHSLNSLHTEEIFQIYKDLEIPDVTSDKQDFMSPRMYSRLFRTLYNGSYVSHFYSNEALELLTYTKFDQGIVSATKSTVVAHKFGEFTNQSEKRELHDCGIAYYPQKPYFICVMTKGQDFTTLEKIISDLSKITFDYMQKQE